MLFFPPSSPGNFQLLSSSSSFGVASALSPGMRRNFCASLAPFFHSHFLRSAAAAAAAAAAAREKSFAARERGELILRAALLYY